MKVILLSDVPRVGKKYNIVDVAPGYARNFLFARLLAEPVTRQNGKRIAELTKKREVEVKKQEAHLDKTIGKVAEVSMTILRKANEEGHLYAGVTKEELALELGKIVGANYAPDNIVLEKPIKELGEYSVTVSVGTKESAFTLSVKEEVEAE
jgi:large subunit ribosomal protein L9